MKVRNKIAIMLIVVLIFVTFITRDIDFYSYEKDVFSNIERMYILAVVIMLYIFLAYFLAKFIYKMTMTSVYDGNDKLEELKIESLLSNIPGGMINIGFSKNEWKINYVSLWCYEVFGYNEGIKIDKKMIIDMIYDMDKPLVREAFNNILAGSEYSEKEIRIKRSCNQLMWVKIKVNGIYNSKGELEKVTIIIIDIDDMKKENEELLFKAERDSLTGVLNKGTVIGCIEEFIEQRKENGAFIIIDIDNFKLFNDLLGHIYGDEALIKVSQLLEKVFGENAFIGRIGGDEFCVFVKNFQSYECVEDMIKRFLSLIRDNKIGDERKLSLLVSVGMAKYPEHGKTVRELYINSDKALYVTKDKGKNGYSIYE